MSLSSKQLKIRRALLAVLQDLPDSILLPDDLLRAEASRLVLPRPTTAELDEQIEKADASRQILGIQGDEGTKWKITDVGRAWLGEHR